MKTLNKTKLTMLSAICTLGLLSGCTSTTSTGIDPEYCNGYEEGYAPARYHGIQKLTQAWVSICGHRARQAEKEKESSADA